MGASDETVLGIAQREGLVVVAEAIMAVISVAEDALDGGAQVVVEPHRVRVRTLPFEQP